MRSAEETTTLERRVTWANENWRLFFSEMPLRKNEFELGNSDTSNQSRDFNQNQRQASSTKPALKPNLTERFVRRGKNQIHSLGLVKKFSVII